MTGNLVIPLVVGIDGGGTQTTAVAIDANGVTVARSAAGSSNIKAAGWEQATTVLQQVLAALAVAMPVEVVVVGLHAALAGAGRSGDAERIRQRLLTCCRSGALTSRFGRLAAEAVTVSNDALAVLAAAEAAAGVVAIAGTGSLVWGRNAAGAEARTGGWGYLLGDEGSGYDLGRRALGAVLAAYDGRRGPTALTEAVLAHFALAAPPDLIGRIYDGPSARIDIADVAPLTLRLADEGDATARALLAVSVQALADQVRPVAIKLGLIDEPFPVVCSGGMFQNAAFFEALEAAVADTVIGGQCCRPRRTPAEGAALLAWRSHSLAGEPCQGA